MIRVVEAPLPEFFEFIRNGMSVKQDKEGVGLPITRIETIANGTIDESRFGYAGIQKGEASKWLLRRGDLLFSHINSVDHIGKCALFNGGYDLVHGMNLLCFRPKSDKADSRYFKWLFRSANFRAQIMPFVNKAVNQASLSIGNLSSLRLKIPPLDEQKRIAAILDHADELRRKRQHALDRLNQLGQAIFHDMFGDPKTNPHDFPTIPLGDLIKVSSGSGLIASDQKGGDYPVYGGNGVNGWHDDFTVAAGTIVIGRVGVYCGAVHVTDRSAWVTDNALVVSLKRPVNPAYLAAALKIANLNQYAGRSAQPLVSGSRIYPIEILDPPIDKQNLYEYRIRNFEAVSTDYTAAKRAQEQLFSTLQHSAFRGEL
jgi:type I restriction enzyme S subunit